jgi:hypothetical protein
MIVNSIVTPSVLQLYMTLDTFIISLSQIIIPILLIEWYNTTYPWQWRHMMAPHTDPILLSCWWLYTMAHLSQSPCSSYPWLLEGTRSCVCVDTVYPTSDTQNLSPSCFVSHGNLLQGFCNLRRYPKLILTFNNVLGNWSHITISCCLSLAINYFKLINKDERLSAVRKASQ